MLHNDYSRHISSYIPDLNHRMLLHADNELDTKLFAMKNENLNTILLIVINHFMMINTIITNNLILDLGHMIKCYMFNIIFFG